MIRGGSMLVVVVAVGLFPAAAQEKGEGWLKLIESVPQEDLNSVNTAVISPDGKFLYSSSWQPAKLCVFARDAKTGKLAHKQTMADEDFLGGVTSIALSPDGRFALAASFRSKAAALYLRNATTGELSRSDAVRDGEKGVSLQFAVVAAFSPDSRFGYILDDNGAVVAFRLNDGKLELVDTDQGKDECYAGARGIAFHPDGKTIFVACQTANALVAADRDPETGKTSVRQIVKDEADDVHGLAGAMGVVVSPTGRFVYVASGRFQGDDAVSVFQFTAERRLILVQEFLNGKGEFQGFEGGNHLAISPDGLNVYAAATRSGTVACFRRHPTSGRLTYLETIPDGGEGGPLGATAAGISPDGKFVYVPTEDKKSISVFERRADP
jgi:6-phosphogluconolactonase (cycloisomerase 2 family)